LRHPELPTELPASRYHKSVEPQELPWQSNLILLVVIPWVLAGVFFDTRGWGRGAAPEVAYWTLGLSALLGLLAWAARSGTFAAAETGALITASLMYASTQLPYDPFETALGPVLILLVLTSLATRFGLHQKLQLGTAEKRHGRAASQVAANLGVAALMTQTQVQIWLIDHKLFAPEGLAPMVIFIPSLAALAEAAADTVSSEIGQVVGGTPLMLTTLERVEPGTDGGITLAGSLAGVWAAAVVAGIGALALNGGLEMMAVALAGAVFGLFFDSLLGATLERRGVLNNDAVNFVSTTSAAAFSLLVLAILPHPVAS
jgi:uncharacterized protein (TIGR00297 family)